MSKPWFQTWGCAVPSLKAVGGAGTGWVAYSSSQDSVYRQCLICQCAFLLLRPQEASGPTVMWKRWFGCPCRYD